MRNVGSVIGEKRFTDSSMTSPPYPRSVVASTAVEFIEWELEGLREFAEKEKAVRASILAILYSEAIERVKKDKYRITHNQYRKLLSAVVLDGYIDDRERAFIAEHKQDLQISDQEHLAILQGLGWDRAAWERGYLAASPDAVKAGAPAGAGSAEVLRAAAVLEQVALGLRGGRAL